MDTSQIIAHVAGVVLLVLGLAMLTGGIALLIGGDIEFKSGRRLPKPVSRKVGILLVSFFPLVMLLGAGLRLLDPERAVPPALLNWPIALVYVVLGLVWLRRGLRGDVTRAIDVAPAPVSPQPEAQDGAPLPEFDGPVARRPSRQPRDGPFDFS